MANKQQNPGQQGQQDKNIGKGVQNAGHERNTLDQSTLGQSTLGQSTLGQSTPGQSTPGQSTLGQTEQQASYWRDQYRNEPYVTKGQKFEEYSPAYRTGYEGRSQYAGQRFEDVENDLERDYTNIRGDSTLGWDKAKQACRAAWDRADQFVSSSQADRQQGR